MNEEHGDDDLFIELSTRELRALDAVSVISSLFSIAGSTFLLIMLWRERRVQWTSHHRFLFGLSAFDIVVSFLRYTLLPWTGSSEPSPSCTFQGTMIMFTTIAPLYNMSLSLYYVSIIRYQIRPKAFATRFEPFLHVFSIGLPFVVGMLLLATQGYNPSGSVPSCSLSAYPPGCDLPASTVPCERGELAAAMLFYAYTPMFLLVLVLLFGSNFLIFLYVRKLEARNLHWRSFSMRNSTRNNTRNNNAVADVSTEERRANFRRTRLVATQSFLYLAAFLLANIWPTVGGILSINDGLGVRRGEYFGWLLAMHMCHPAQGCFNVMVYIRGVLRQRDLDSSRPAGSLSRSARQPTEGDRRERLAAAICCDCWGTGACSTCCRRQPSATVPAAESENGNCNDANNDANAINDEALPQGSVEIPSPVNVASEPEADSSSSSSSSLSQEPPTPTSTVRSTTTTSQQCTTSPLAEESN